MIEAAASSGRRGPADRRLLRLSLIAVVVGLAAALVAALLLALINGLTHLAFEGVVSTAPVAATIHAPPWRILLTPLVGAIAVGVMARWGSAAIRGHGIPEVMERILVAGSRIPARLTILKPASAAITIGTGGPFGAEGPIIATGGALGSVLGQAIRVSDQERKVLLAAGAAAGMAATFDAPVAAVLLAIELLLFEYRAASIVPVALAVSAATALRLLIIGDGPVFPMPAVAAPDAVALLSYAFLGAVIGMLAAAITAALHRLERGYERLPFHWMWWPLLGALVLGGLAVLEPRILGVGYANIADILGGRMAIGAVAMVVGFKLVAWLVYLASGTSGGTLAPLFTFGSGFGALLGTAAAAAMPEAGIAVPTAALVGMAAMFAGASRALLASVVFAFEVTRQPQGLLPLLAGCTAAVLLSRLLSRHTIMTAKLADRGLIVPDEYAADHLAGIAVGDWMTADVVAFDAEEPIRGALARIDSAEGPAHQAFPVVNADGQVLGVIRPQDLRAADGATVGEAIRRPPVVITPERTMREAADLMVRSGVGRLPVVEDGSGRRLLGILSRSDLLLAHEPRLRGIDRREVSIRFRRWIGRPPAD